MKGYRAGAPRKAEHEEGSSIFRGEPNTACQQCEWLANGQSRCDLLRGISLEGRMCITPFLMWRVKGPALFSYLTIKNC